MLLVDVALGDADVLRAGAVDIDVEAGTVERLLDARIRKAGHAPHAVRSIPARRRNSPATFGPADLQVDRRRRAEVQDLADDVGRQERERHAGKRAAAIPRAAART